MIIIKEANEKQTIDKIKKSINNNKLYVKDVTLGTGAITAWLYDVKTDEEVVSITEYTVGNLISKIKNFDMKY